MGDIITVEDARPLIAKEMAVPEEHTIQVTVPSNESTWFDIAVLCERCNTMERVELTEQASIAKWGSEDEPTRIRDYIYSRCNHCGTGYWCWYGPEHDFRDVFRPQPIGGQV